MTDMTHNAEYNRREKERLRRLDEYRSTQERCQGCSMYMAPVELKDGLCNGCTEQARILGLEPDQLKAWAATPGGGRLFEYRAFRRGLI